jgi:hypothetical protein
MQLMVFQLSLFRIHPGTAVRLPGNLQEQATACSPIARTIRMTKPHFD